MGKPWHYSNGLLYRFCKQYAIVSKKITGEGLDCPDYSKFIENTLKPLLQEYKPNDIYINDKTSFSIRCLPTEPMPLEMKLCGAQNT